MVISQGYVDTEQIDCSKFQIPKYTFIFMLKLLSIKMSHQLKGWKEGVLNNHCRDNSISDDKGIWILTSLCLKRNPK